MILLLPFVVLAGLLAWFAVAVAADRDGLRADLTHGLHQVGQVHLAVVSASSERPRTRQ